MECKSVTVTSVEGLMGINRYIMECKCDGAEGRNSKKGELIDTLWNVNSG